MKKLFAFISLFLLLGIGSAFADVTVKKLADGNVEVTFFYGNPRATEVLLAGDFNNWQNGAEAMTKTEKGFTITKTFKATDELRYKFISDGNWTTDLKAPDFVDDGFGGKNSHVVIADMISGDDDAGAAKAKINFVSWTMFGVQGQFNTAKSSDPSSKGIDLDNATVGFKSYDKFVGNFLPNCPLYIEVALAETELDPYQSGNGNGLYLYQLDGYGNEVVGWEDGLKNLVNGVAGNPVSYLARTDDNSSDKKGPGSNPFLGHLKFGFNTPYVKYYTGFNYAKMDARKNILWTTIDGSNWDAGYEHVGGFNVFSLGDKPAAAIEEATGLKVDVAFAPNKSADRKGRKYGLWTAATVSKDDFVAEVQYNSFYTDDYLFYKPFEHDFIFGAKGKIGDISIGGQALINAYENLDVVGNKNFWSFMDYTGYSRSAVYLDDAFDFTKDVAAEINVGYKNDFINAKVDYRFRGWETNMLYVEDHHQDSGKDVQLKQLGTLNSQRVTLDLTVTPTEALSLNFVPYFETQFSTSDWEEYAKFYADNAVKNSRIDMASKDSKRFVGYLKADYNLEDVIGMPSSISGYGKVKYVTEDEDKYAGYDSNVLFSNAGLKFSMSDLGDTLKGFDFYYGLDNTNDEQMFNTFILSAAFAGDVKADLSFGLRSATKEFDGDVNNPFGFGVGVAKKFKAFKKPTVYAQFVYDMDPYKPFGDGQDALNLDGYCLGEKVKNNGDNPLQDAVNVYEGKAAVRVGIRWDI